VTSNDSVKADAYEGYSLADAENAMQVYRDNLPDSTDLDS